jgi:hypothetical protein
MRRIVLPIFLLIFFGASAAQEKQERYSEVAGGFSFIVPPGWKISESPSGKYKVVYGQRADDFTPNITSTDYVFVGEVRDFALMSRRTFEDSYREIGIDSARFLSQADFTTDVGQLGVKLSYEVRSHGKEFAFRQYIFEGGNKTKLIFTCVSLASSASAVGQMCDASMKSLTVKK